MSFQLLLNVIIAFTWMFLRGIWTLPSFIIGFFWGAELLFIFIRELFKANIAVTKDVLRPKLNIQPAIFAMPTRLESEWEITILSLLITLTPGTLVMDVSDDNSTIYIHAINTDDIDDIITDIQQTFEKAIMEVSR